MKRFLLLIVLAAITAAAIWYGFYHPRRSSTAAVAALLPKNTLALVHLPDFSQARADLHRSDLYQIWEEPAVRDFLAKPREKIPAGGGIGEVVRDCESLQMKDAFVALVSLDNSAWKIVGGFRFRGDPAEAEKIVANWKTKALGPELKHETMNYQAHAIQVDSAGLVSLATVHDGQWFFVANDAEQLKPLLDRVDGRAKDKTTLAEDELFTGAGKRMPASYAALVYGRVDQIMEKLMPLAEKNSAVPADGRAILRQIRSFCGTTAFDGGKIRDTFFVAMPKMEDEGKITRASLAIATKETFLYAAGFLNLSRNMELPGAQAPLGWMAGWQKMANGLSSNGVTLEEWKNAFGSEFGLVGSWPTTSHWPSIFASLPVRDFTKARKILAAIAAMPAENGTTWRQQEKEGVLYFSSEPAGQFFSLSPTIGLSERMLVAGADLESVEAAMKRSDDGNSELASAKTFQAAERAVPAAEKAFTYIDPALLYSRVDETLRPMLFMSAAFLPGLADTLDLSKLPSPETITKHLSPIVMSQRYDGEGYVAESVGPVTTIQTIAGVAALGGAAAIFYQQQTHAWGRNRSAPTTTTAPALSPSPTPEDSP